MKPILLHYYITNRCNSQCTFCDIWQSQPKKDAIPDQVLPNLQAARKAGCRFVDFTGGEPLLNPHLPEFLHEARRLGFFTSVTTNCILFPQKAVALDRLVDFLHFSIDADTAAIHNSLRGADSFNAVWESVPLALAHHLAPDLLFTYTDETIDYFEGVYRRAREHRIMVILDPVFNLDGKDNVSPATHARARMLGKLPGVYLNKAHLSLRKRGGNQITNPRCCAAGSTIVILPDNTLVLPCYHHANKSVPINSSLSSALISPERRDALKNQGTYPFCEGCHINCYFDPSFTHAFDFHTLQSLAAKAKYWYYKYLIYKHRFR
jgi:MoaA/NifB/PqqE/SkfB family radical SAM enzyme